jgi:Molecular chaperone
MSEIIVGIDLGTTNSEIAIVAEGQAKVLADGELKILPSFVGIADDGSLLVGEAARNQYALYPERTVKSIKRLMGSNQSVVLAEKAYTPQEISAIILKRLKAIAEKSLGQPVKKAVITVPAYFSDAQRQATREAGEIAGFEVARMINEPTAAALSYETGHPGRKRVLVYDLGGGTFDVSVVNLEQEVVEVIASHGNNHLGGDDFDQEIVSHITEHLQKEHGVDVRDSKKAMARIIRAAEAGKRILSDRPYVRIEEEYIADKNGEPVHLSLELSREDYEKMIARYIDETLEAVHIALKDANLTVSDIEEILLVGGSTRTPVVSRRLEEEFKQQPRGEVDPDLCVALGAAIQGGVISGETVSSVLVDVTPYTFGTSALGELDGVLYPHVFVPIIRKNTQIPVTRTEAFYTLFDNQKRVEVNVYQGEKRDALKNIQIGEFSIGGLGRAPAGNTILVQFKLDLDGILHVTAQEKKTGLEKSITIENAMKRFEGEALVDAKKRIGALFKDDEAPLPKAEATEKERHHAMVQARALIEKAERLLDNASPEDREDMVNLIEEINDALKRGDLSALEQPVEQLSDMLYYLES